MGRFVARYWDGEAPAEPFTDENWDHAYPRETSIERPGGLAVPTLVGRLEAEAPCV